MDGFLAAIKKYAVFAGRARRKEYWSFTLIYLLISIILAVFDAIIGHYDERSGWGLLSGLFAIATFLPATAVAVRRLHDIGRSGWWLLILFVPLIGLVVFLVFATKAGDAEDNGLRGGPDRRRSGPAMRVLVTGASGRIGRAICVRLMPEHDVLGFDRAPSSTADVLADLGDADAMAAAMRGVDAVVHAAALHAPHVGRVPDSEFERINVAATQTLLDAAIRARVRHIVYTSTTALYGSASAPPNAAGWVTEDLAPQPATVYHRTKLAAEALLVAAAAAGGLAVTIVRMSRCFPEPAPLMAAYRLHRGVDARDVADAHALALQRSGAAHRTFIVSGATPFEPADAPALLRDAPAVLRRRAPELCAAFERRGWPLPASIDRVCCAERAASELGWVARFGFDEVLRMLDERMPEVLPLRRRWQALE
jgi:UDP-glucose 4-epimerase